MALSILDGNQSATTLSTILSSGQHITAHTVVSLGTQAITDMRSAVSGSVVSIPFLPAISGTVTANVSSQDIYRSGSPTAGSSFLRSALYYEDLFGGAGEFLRVHNDGGGLPIRTSGGDTVAINGTVTIGSALPAGTNRIGVVTIGAGTVTIGAGTAQIGSVTASLQASSITGSLKSLTYQDISTVAFLNVAVGSLPALASGTAQIGSVTASISNSVTISSLPAISGTVTANTFAVQGTAVTTSNFTSTTPSTVLANFNAGREVLTIFNEGAGNLHICAGATCTTIAYQVRLSAGDYYEMPNHQTTITHSAVFATAGTARVTQVS